ncbi:MAG: tetratricopeptide repeat protein [Bacteroidales bacterium]|jgi:tetratricopeptide (TPR) repeat protein|nr:tetratricopeptide repeat protein [Bacteroidales bacterium]MCK9499145.1 tetratricopeptide repeat protein [Bacteroidales bacterium]MDY0314494.1 tetratricopeptide repeat protein [Bacteroidales bacterium]NLB86794.1 tetratricopeptide repeat protein [Bacteroidales bacterium]
MLKYFFILSVPFLFLLSCNNHKTKIGEDILNDSTLSIEHLDKLIRENPNNAKFYLKRSELYLAKEKNIEKAILDMETALRVDTTMQEVYIKLADLYLANANSEMSKKVLERCLKRYPFNVDARIDLAKIYFYVQMYQEAMSEILKIEANNLQNTDSYFVKALILNETFAYQDAITALKKSIDYDNKNWEAYNLIGMIYAKLDDSLALDFYKTAASLFPENDEVQFNSAWVHQQFGELTKAIEFYDNAISIDSSYYEAYYNAGFIYANDLKDYFKAIDYFSKAIACDPFSHKAWYNRGYSYEQTSQLKLAEEDYRQSLKIHPNYEPAVEGINIVIDKQRK